MMRRIKHLNVNNSYASANYQLESYTDFEKGVVKVTRANEKEVNQVLKLPPEKQTEYHFIIWHDQSEMDSLNSRIFKSNARVSYYTNSTVPIGILLKLQGNKRAEVVYLVRKEYTISDIENIDAANRCNGVKVVIYCPITSKEDSPEALIKALYPLRYLTDMVVLSFSSKVQKEYHDEEYSDTLQVQSRYYLQLHEFMARILMQLKILCDEDKKELINKEVETYVTFS